MKRKIRIRALLVIFFVCLSILMLALSLRLIFKPKKVAPIVKEPNTLRILAVDNFASNDFDFRFSIITFAFKAVDETTYNLNNLVSEEGIKVADTDKYLAQLQAKSLSLVNVDLVSSLLSKGSETIGKAFIAYQKENGLLELKDKKNNYIFNVDIEKDVHDFSTFKPKTGALVKEEKFLLSISDSYICERVNYQKEEYLYPSSLNIYAYVVEVKDISDDNLIIEEATFVPNGSSEKYKALGKDYSDVRGNKDSIIAKNLKKGDSGVLLFEIYSPSGEDIERNGLIYLKIKNSDKLLQLSTELR